MFYAVDLLIFLYLLWIYSMPLCCPFQLVLYWLSSAVNYASEKLSEYSKHNVIEYCNRCSFFLFLNKIVLNEKKTTTCIV